MRAVVIERTGGPEVMKLVSHELDAPGPGVALVRHRAIGVNFIDTYQRSGLYALPLPAVLGSEAAGVVEAAGPGVSLAVGARVAYASAGNGAYAEQRLVPADKLVPLPDDIDDETAAASLLKGMTVEYLVCRTRPVRAGETVLFFAAAGGVGLLACQWLRSIGAHVIGAVGSDEKAAIAREHGAEHTIVTSREDVAERVRELTHGKGVPVVFDSVGKATLQASLDSLAPRGMLVSFGNASGKPDPLDLLTLSNKGSLYVTRPKISDYVATRDELVASASALFEKLRSGALRVRIDRRFPLAEAGEAHRALESRKTSGSVVLLP
ncbi:MAG TPA: quinone oxidoreductase [Polyangiaceae bacterium]